MIDHCVLAALECHCNQEFDPRMGCTPYILDVWIELDIIPVSTSNPWNNLNPSVATDLVFFQVLFPRWYGEYGPSQTCCRKVPTPTPDISSDGATPMLSKKSSLGSFEAPVTMHTQGCVVPEAWSLKDHRQWFQPEKSTHVNIKLSPDTSESSSIRIDLALDLCERCPFLNLGLHGDPSSTPSSHIISNLKEHARNGGQSTQALLGAWFPFRMW